MKRKIAILGSTSSIGKNLLNIIKKDKKNFKIELLTANTNYKDLINQAKKFNVKNLIITDLKSFEKSKKFYKGKKINIFKNFENLKSILPKKVDYVMSAISGIGGLSPTYKIIKHTKKIAIANKESIICGWNLISKELKNYKTNFIPIDSEHFSINELTKSTNHQEIEKIYITASGGPFLNRKLSDFKNIKVRNAIKHPNWRMGKKISIDSATLINKVYELIEAKKIFDLEYDKIDILIQPSSYVHSVIKFYGGTIKVLIHDTSMEIPIFNSLYEMNKSKIYMKNKLNLNLLNDLNFQNIPTKKFPIHRILKLLPKSDSLFETVLVSVNDTLVDLFLTKKISYNDIHFFLNKILRSKEFQKYKSKVPKNVNEILRLNEYVRLKTLSLGVV